ncbi:DNA-binding IclR family transcriptional regulator [Novosphingobium sp. PhB165]|uniref:IclR family transcriptional regulator n=1 Tax=Novosphingobium sp. PhB165 TaxID=2485105 RepID=UPI0010E43683|nr:helix-turn-helix domain-containing protein [Novosphingobium sp. PhB165]TCM20441.1 DNA-binding IclR family transcriptional regulator [Novosphingobium sp. PhB165]
MPDTSNPTARVIDVLNFLTARPTESFSLAEIARHLGLSNGSAHRILTTLAGAGFLSRNEKQRTYSLGMAMVAIGQAAVEKHRGIDIARREIARLALELNVQCSANTVVDDEILVLAKEGTPQSHRGLTRVGERRPLVPPLGLCHVAWGGDAVIDAYLDKATPHISEAVRARLLAAFPVIRRRGYAVAANGPSTSHAREATALPAGQKRDEAYWSSVFDLVSHLTPREVQLLDLSDLGEDGIGYITAPVFSPTGTVSLQLVISGIPRNLSVGEIEHYADRLGAIAAFITDETHGRRP